MTNASEVSQGEQTMDTEATEKPQIMGPIPLVDITGEDSETRTKPPGRAKERTVRRKPRRVLRHKIR